MDEENKKKILVVDDDENLRAVLVDKLSAEGFEVEGAVDGAEGIRKAIESHPDLIMLDIIMPHMDGWQMLEELRKDAWGRRAKVIFLTNVSDMESVSHALEKGNYEYIVKTDWSLDDVVKKVRGVLIL